MKRVYVAMYGVGLGHASRMLLVADNLQSDATLRFSSFGDAVNYTKMQGFECFSIPSVEFAWGIDRGFSVKESIIKLPQNLLHFTAQLGMEGKYMGSFKPDVVVSDTRLSSLFMAKVLDIPCIAILNQIKLLLSPRLREFRVARLFETMLAELLGSLWSKSDSILIPDLPPPYTLSEQNLWAVGSTTNKLKYVGFLAPKPKINGDYADKVGKLLQLDRKKKIVFAHISGPYETKVTVLKKIKEAFQEIKNNEIEFVVSEGEPNGDTTPRKIKNGWYFQWCPFRDEIFAMSNLIIMRGGHSTLAQAIQYGKPVITIPIEKQGEQLGNAKKVQKIGFGLMLNQRGLKSDDICSAVEQVLNDSRFANNAEMLMDVANKLNGIEEIANVVRSYF